VDYKYGLKIETQPASQPVSVADAKSHMRIVGFDADDTYIDLCIRAATEFVEKSTNHTLIPTQYLFVLDQFPFNIYNRNVPYDHRRNAIVLPRNPVISVDEFEYTDNDGNDNLITDYILSKVITPARIVPARGEIFPFADYYGLEAIRIKFTAGYANGDYTYLAGQCILHMVAHMYENRQPITDKSYSHIPFTVQSMMRKLKLSGFLQ
jgi:uncharacterized phiE125 gp8 family phage protein